MRVVEATSFQGRLYVHIFNLEPIFSGGSLWKKSLELTAVEHLKIQIHSGFVIIGERQPSSRGVKLFVNGWSRIKIRDRTSNIDPTIVGAKFLWVTPTY